MKFPPKKMINEMKRKAAIILGLSIIIVISTSVGIYYGLEKKKSDELNKLEIPEGLNFYKTSGAIELKQVFGTTSFNWMSAKIPESYTPNIKCDRNSISDLILYDNEFLGLSTTEYKWTNITSFSGTNNTFIPIWVNRSISSNVLSVLSYNITSPDLEIASIFRLSMDRSTEELMTTGLYSYSHSEGTDKAISNCSINQGYYNGFDDEDNFNYYFGQNSSIKEHLSHNFNLTESITIEWIQNIFFYHDEGGLKVMDEHYAFWLSNITISFEIISENSIFCDVNGWLRDYQFVFLDVVDLPDTKSHLMDYDRVKIQDDNLAFYNV